jgi:hypothetical protein
MTNNPIIADALPHAEPSPMSRDEEIARLQWTVGILIKRYNEMLDRLMAIERQQVAAMMATPVDGRRRGAA